MWKISTRLPISAKKIGYRWGLEVVFSAHHRDPFTNGHASGEDIPAQDYVRRIHTRFCRMYGSGSCGADDGVGMERHDRVGIHVDIESNVDAEAHHLILLEVHQILE